MNIATEIKKRRSDLGISQAELGERVGVSQGKIGDWERGTQSPSYESILKLSSALGPFTIDSQGQPNPTTNQQAENTDDHNGE